MNEVIAQENTGSEGTAKIIYILYLLGIVFGITGIIGVVMAYINQAEAQEWLKSHYRFQIRTFWIGALYMLLGVLLAFFIIGYLILLFWIVWLVVRCAKGIKYLDQKQAYPNPTGWLF